MYQAKCFMTFHIFILCNPQAYSNTRQNDLRTDAREVRRLQTRYLVPSARYLLPSQNCHSPSDSTRKKSPATSWPSTSLKGVQSGGQQ